MNAKTNLKDVMAQAEVDYGLKDDVPEHTKLKSVIDNQDGIELEIAEEIEGFVKQNNHKGDIWLGFVEGTIDSKDSLRLSIQNSFIEELVEAKILKSAINNEIWDEDGYSWVATKRIVIDENKVGKLQTKIAELKVAAKEEGVVRLVVDEVNYDAKSGILSFGKLKCGFKKTKGGHLFLDYMSNKAMRGTTVDADLLYEIVFGKEMSVKYRGERNEERNKQVKDLWNVKANINEQIRKKFNTIDDLIYSGGGCYRRDY